MNTKANVFRPSLTDVEIQALCYDIDMYKAQGNNVDPNTNLAIGKLKTLMLKANMNIIKPAYAQVGRKSSVTISLEALNEMAPNVAVVDSPAYVGIERRTNDSSDHAVNYTAEQMEDAKFAAADYKIQTGVDRDWHEFLVVSQPKQMNKEIEQSNDKKLFESL